MRWLVLSAGGAADNMAVVIVDDYLTAIDFTVARTSSHCHCRQTTQNRRFSWTGDMRLCVSMLSADWFWLIFRRSCSGFDVGRGENPNMNVSPSGPCGGRGSNDGLPTGRSNAIQPLSNA